mmetsp:Transcript_13075/g.31986  ORF Transcript_13075/g.31986 Transcript_13075/m.31986 type:complete len:229 (-) Transcript_13075:16-702(-)
MTMQPHNTPLGRSLSGCTLLCACRCTPAAAIRANKGGCSCSKVGAGHLQVAPAAVLVLVLAGAQGADDAKHHGHQGDQEEQLQQAAEEGDGHDEGGHDGEAAKPKAAKRREEGGGHHGGAHHHVVHSGGGGGPGGLHTAGLEARRATHTPTALRCQGLLGHDRTSQHGSSAHSHHWQSQAVHSGLLAGLHNDGLARGQRRAHTHTSRCTQHGGHLCICARSNASETRP